MSNTEQTVEQTIQKHRLIRSGDTVLLAVSGGPDSMAMLHVFLALRHRLGCRLIVGHVNHNLRKGAAADEAFVRKTCAALHLPLVVASVRPGAAQEPGSQEERARDKRMAALVRIARTKKCAAIVLAHHRQDAAETVLMRVLRGTGLMGLQGILPGREMHGTLVIRPLITLKRKEIDDYLRENKIPFRRDPTNRNKRFFRNRLRHELLPLLQTYNPGVIDVLAGLGETSELDYNYIESKARKAFQKIFTNNRRSRSLCAPVALLKKLDPSLCRTVIRLAFAEAKGDLRQLTLDHIHGVERLLSVRAGHAMVDLPAGIRVMRDNDHIRLIRRNSC